MQRSYVKPETLRERRRLQRTIGVPISRIRRAYLVKPSAIPIPDWLQARALKGLTNTEDSVWLLRTDAWILEKMDRECGGTPHVLECEFRRCQICRRPLLSEDAESRRVLNDGAMTGNQLPCGNDCFAAARDKRWR